MTLAAGLQLAPSLEAPDPLLEAKRAREAGDKIRASVVTNGGHLTPRKRWRHHMAQIIRMEESADEGQTGGLLHNVRLALPHVVIFSSTIVYSVVGAIIFQRLEQPFEVLHLQKHSLAISQAQKAVIQLRLTANGSQHPLTNGTVGSAIDELIRVSLEAFEEGIHADELFPLRVYNGTGAEQMRHAKWNFHSALFFTATLLTSIGYGNLVPISPLGRIFCVLYGFLGIPLTLMSIADVAKFAGDQILAAEGWMEERIRGKEQMETEREKRRALEHQGGGLFRVAGTYTKIFVLSLLLAYMLAMAVIFSRIQRDWGLLESLYFTLITLVTIGFGDFCPAAEPEGEGHYGGWILFIFVGLTLSTLTVDLVGSTYIDRIHTLGRGFHLGSFLTMLKLGRGECPDSERVLRQLHRGAYIPADFKLIPYIDLFARPSQEAEVLSNGVFSTSAERKPERKTSVWRKFSARH